MKVYVASSWRNTRQPQVVRELRSAGFEVYDFREPSPGNHGFSWHEIDPSIPRGPADLTLSAEAIVRMLDHNAARDGFRLDLGALEWCDALVLVLPCGRSAHLEAGWAVGAGKLTVGLMADGEPDLMWKMLDHLCVDVPTVVDALTRHVATGRTIA
jgi:nucleoside 2-deoxyribosyltransferase